MDSLDASLIQGILLDIEGTTTPIDFVYQTLFPYARRNLEGFLREHAGDPEVRALMQDLRDQRQSDERHGLQPPPWVNEPEEVWLLGCVAYAHWLIDRDSKCTALKALQGKIWRQGYENGALRGQVYPDVPAALKRWRRQNKFICIYSSGSVLAQKLLFCTTSSGDLTSSLSGFFDTGIGAKSDPESYKKIAASLSRAPREFLFVSDAVKEIEAAQSAGMRTLLCHRDPKVPSSPAGSIIIHSFDEVFPD